MVADIGSIDMSGISTSISLTGLNVTLQPSTSYWLKFNDVNLSPGSNGTEAGILKWLYSPTPSGVGASLFVAQPEDATLAGAVAFESYALIGQINTAPVPEPTNYAAMSALALAGFGMGRRMQR